MSLNSTALFQSSFGRHTLGRFPEPHTSDSPLQAWNAADEYLLQWVADANLSTDTSTLVLNDTFGALSTALPMRPLWSQSDSFMAQVALQQNLALNEVASPPNLLNSLQWPPAPIQLVVIQLPKQLALLEHQLYGLRAIIDADTLVVAGGMVKHWPNRAQELFTDILGPSHTTLAQKKARLLVCHPQPDSWQGSSPYPTHYGCEELQAELSNHANVFSRQSLDIGTRFLLSHLPTPAAGARVADLGCGNGILGIQTKRLQPGCEVHFIDESHMAIDSSRTNACNLLGSVSDCHFHTDHCLQNFAPDSLDLIINNPPFHQQNTVGDHLAWQMFVDARRALVTGGELWIVGNRHLNYHHKLKRLFGNCTTVASNRKFVILKARKNGNAQ